MNTEKLMGIVMSLLGAVTVILLLGLTACSGTTGWRVSFGVAPVKQIDDRQQLTQEPRRVTSNKAGY